VRATQSTHPLSAGGAALSRAPSPRGPNSSSDQPHVIRRRAVLLAALLALPLAGCAGVCEHVDKAREGVVLAQAAVAVAETGLAAVEARQDELGGERFAKLVGEAQARLDMARQVLAAVAAGVASLEAQCAAMHAGATTP